jgi:hypothetical protein
VDEGWNGQSTVAGARTTAGTPFPGQTPVNSCLGRVGSAWGRTIVAGVGLAAGTGVGAGLTRRGVARAGLSAGACSGVARARRTPKRANLGI